MKYAADFRYIAREALRGKWLIAVLTAFVASLIGAQIASGGGGGGSNNNDNNNSGINLNEYFSPEVLNFFRIALAALLVYAVISIIISLIIGGAGKLGYARFNLNLVDGKEARFEDLFSQFHRLGDGFVMVLLMGIYEFLWSLLFVIPGIIVTYQYRFALYNLYENPDIGFMEALRMSKQQTRGYKLQLFELDVSYLGWFLLASIPSFMENFLFYQEYALSILGGGMLSLPAPGHRCSNP